MEFIHLSGAETVLDAANAMRCAAEDMKKAANNMEQVLFSNQRFLDDWLNRFEDIMQAKEK
jgi:hypothetical protein